MVIRPLDLEEQNQKLLMELFVRNGLEYSVDEPIPTDMIAGWEARDDEGRLAGGCILAMRQGEYIIDGIAVEPEYRNSDVGSRLLAEALELVRARGGATVYLVARAPGFFMKHGFRKIDRESAPVFFECFGCDQFNISCFPEVMRLDISKDNSQR